jgi:hypothetical protein
VDWIHLAQGTDNWWASVSRVMYLRVPENPWSYLTGWKIVNFSRRALLHGGIFSTWLISQSVHYVLNHPIFVCRNLVFPKRARSLLSLVIADSCWQEYRYRGEWFRKNKLITAKQWLANVWMSQICISDFISERRVFSTYLQKHCPQ